LSERRKVCYRHPLGGRSRSGAADARGCCFRKAVTLHRRTDQALTQIPYTRISLQRSNVDVTGCAVSETFRHLSSVMSGGDIDSSSDDEGGFTTTNVTLGYASQESTGDDISHIGGYPVRRRVPAGRMSADFHRHGLTTKPGHLLRSPDAKCAMASLPSSCS
jgi:hypothetical protein